MTVVLNGINHVGVTVTDLDRSLDFYRRAFGKEAVNRGVGSGRDVGRTVGVGDEARIRYAFLDIGNTRIELNQYEIPEGRRDFDLRACDTGAVHICFQIEDVAAAYRQLTEQGIEFFSPPIHLDETFNELAGISYVYFRDPDGVLLQLYQLPTSS